MFKEVPMTANRHVVNDLMRRAQRFHCPVSAVFEYDVTTLRTRLREVRRGGAQAGLASFLVKATARLIEDHPDLNRHLFTNLLGRQRVVQFEGIHCNLVVARRNAARENVLFPVVIKDANLLSVAQIEAIIRHHKGAPLQELEQIQAMEKIQKLPRLALSLFSYKARSDPHFYAKYFGTYGLSSLVTVGGHGMGGATLANTCVAFLPGAIRTLPRMAAGSVQAREVLTFGIVYDHYLMDGIQMLRAGEDLAALIESPDALLDDPGSLPSAQVG